MSETPAHEDYLTVEHFAMLRETTPDKFKHIGDSVAILVKENGKIVIKYGLILDSNNVDENTFIHVIHRDGSTTKSVPYDYVTRI